MKRKRGGIVSQLLMILLVVVIIFPLYFMTANSFKTHEEYVNNMAGLPQTFTVQNFVEAFRGKPFGQWFMNSLILTVAAVFITGIIALLAGYAFAKYEFKGKKMLFAVVVATLAIPQQLGLVGFVMEMRWIGMNNTLFPLIVSGIANAFGVFWMRQFIESSVPDEIIESGRVDGCKEFGIFFRLIMPIIKPALITIFLLFFLWSWNNYMTPLVMISDQKYYTIPLSIALISSEYRTDYAARILALSMGTIPILILFSFGSKHLIRGLVAGSVKG